MSKALVFGASGQMARALVPLLAERGWQVDAVTRAGRDLPDALAQQVLAAGLWEPEALTDLLRAELHRRETAQKFAKLEGLHQTNHGVLTESQVMEEVKAYRHERRESRS